MIRRYAFVLALCAACALRAQNVVPGASTAVGDVAAFNAEKNETTLRGHASVSDGTTLLLADEIVVNHGTQVATAAGHVAFTRADVRLLADRLVYDRARQTFSAENIRLGSYPYFIEGFSADGTRDEIAIRRARASYGEPGPWQPTINADTIVLAPGRQIRSENVTVGIGHTQPVPIPRFYHSLGAPLIGTLALTGGYRRSLGVFADGSLHVPLNPGLRLGADVGIFTSRGLMVGPSGRYLNPENPDLLHGYFRSGYLHDHGDRKTDLLGRPVPADRAFAEWQHQQTLAPNLTLNAQLNWWKDSEVLRDFRPRAFFPVQEPDTFVESVYTGPNYFVSAFARFRPNSFHRVQERLPEVRFDLLPLAVGNGFYERFNASAAVLRERPPGESITTAALSSDGRVVSSSRTLPARARQSNRLDAYYAIERPFAPAEWLAFTPIAGGRLTHYANSKETRIVENPSLPPSFGVSRVAPGDYTRLLGEVGADAALRASGTFDYKNPQWKIDGLRHLVTPRLGYRYIPEAGKGRARIPQIDREVFATYLPPLGLGDVRAIDDLHATNTLRLGIDNVLQTRDPAEGTRDLLVLNVANDFRFRRRPGERDVSEIHSELAVMPARWLQADVYHSFAAQSGTLREFNSGLTLRDGREWSVRVGNNYLRHEIQDYSIDGRARINERFEALTRLHYDARRHRFNEQAYGLVQNLGNTWLVSYTVSLYSGRRRESSFGFSVQIDTVRF